jgi:hypothetical protein
MCLLFSNVCYHVTFQDHALCGASVTVAVESLHSHHCWNKRMEKCDRVSQWHEMDISLWVPKDIDARR